MPPFPGRRVIQLLPLVLAAGTTVSADVVIKMKVEADVISNPTRISASDPCQVTLPFARTGDVLTLTLGTDKVRLDRPAMSVILRLDQQRLFFIFPSEKKYAYLKFPVAYQKYRSGLQKVVDPDLFQFRLENLTGPDWLELLPLARGLPLIWEEAARQPETEFKYREETVEIEQREVPSGTYDVPEDYVKIEYDPGCMRAR